MSTITPAQRILIIKLWNQVCKDRSWKSSDRDIRLAKFTEILGREISSMDEIGKMDECVSTEGNVLKSLKGLNQGGFEQATR